MSSILYFVQQKTTAQKPLTIFRSKGLENSIPAVIHDIPIYAFGKTVLASTPLFVNNLGAYMNAYEKEAPVVSFNAWRYFDAYKVLPFDATFLGVPRVKTRALKGTEEDHSAFFTGNSFTRAQTGQAKIYLGIPSPNFLRNAAPFLLEATTSCEKGITNMLGLYAFIKIVKAVKHVSHLNNQVVKGDDVVACLFLTESSTDRMDIEDDDDAESQIVTIGRKFVNSGRQFEESDLGKGGLLANAVSIGDGSLVALPVDKKSTCFIHGPVDDCPFDSGIPIPYFHGSIIGDMLSVITFFQTYLLSTFGKDQKSCVESFADFRNGCRFLESTKKGMELTHMVKCLELALTTGRQIYFCIEGEEYCGAVIGGVDFSIMVKSKVYEPLVEDKFIEGLKAVKGHEAHVTALMKFLSKMKLKEAVQGTDGTEDVVRDQMNFARSVYREIHRRIIKDGDDTEKTEMELINLLERCSFNTFYKPLTAEFVLQAFDQILNPSKDLWDEQTPLYLPGCALTQSRAAYILSSFGRFAPSLMASKGDKVLFPTDEDRKTDPALQPHLTIPNVLQMNYVAYHMKPINVAVADFNRMVKEKAVVAETSLKGLPAVSSGRFGGKEREMIWYGIATLLKDVKGVAKGSKKRAVDGEGKEDPKKKRKLERAAELFLESMW